MFSSKDLISFVFANENDTYYGDDLLKRDLNQYLWERLHGNYEAVYFLSAEGSSFRVRSFGDRGCSTYTPGKKTLFGFLGGSSEQSEQGEWIQRQLRAKSDATAAFVCSLDDFCAVLSDPRWHPVLAEIAEEKKRTGIFVLTASATAEKSANLLLTSPVFEKLREAAVMDLRGGAPRELYSTLKKRKWDNCIFLNTFTWERIHALLLHLAMEYPDRCESCERLDLLTDYLYAYLRDPELASTERLLPEVPLAGYLMYAELFDWLKNERHWKKFENAADIFAQNDPNRMDLESGSTHIAVLRDPNAYAGRCLKIKLPKWLKHDPEAEEQALGLLHGIHSEVTSPKNRMENQQMVAIAQNLLNDLDAVRDGDSDSYHWVLGALKFCVSHIYAPDEQEKTARILEILQKKQDAIGVFGQAFGLKHNLMLMQGISAEGKLKNVQLQQLKAELYALDQLKTRYADLISAMELGLEMPAKADNISQILDDLDRQINSFKQTLDAVPEKISAVVSVPEPEPELEPETEMELIITDDMYNFIPPPH